MQLKNPILSGFHADSVVSARHVSRRRSFLRVKEARK